MPYDHDTRDDLYIGIHSGQATAGASRKKYDPQPARNYLDTQGNSSHAAHAHEGYYKMPEETRKIIEMAGSYRRFRTVTRGATSRLREESRK